VIDRPALRYHGGKFRLATWIMAHMPPHRTYVEPYGGGAGVLLRKERAGLEVYNDLDGDVVTFFRVVRNSATREQLIERLALTPFARAEFELAYEPTDDQVERAARVAVRSWMGYGAAGAVKSTTGFRVSAKDVLLWSRLPDTLAPVGLRFEGVLIENRPAVDVMLKHDAPDTLHYVDPPYVFATRNHASKSVHRYYRHEMSDWEHLQLLTCLHNLKGMVMLSGYDTAMYHDALAGWAVRSHDTSGGGNRGSVPRTEVLWLNEACAARAGDLVKVEAPNDEGGEDQGPPRIPPVESGARE
jgi:DNA adenine methylase